MNLMEALISAKLGGSGGGGGSGMTEDVKQAFLNAFSHVAWTDEHGQDYYDALEAALYPVSGLVSISAVYTQSGTVYDTDSLDSLKSDLVVTAVFEDTKTETVTAYTLSGTLTVGTSTITVSYGGKTTTFNVTVSDHTLLYVRTGADCVIGGADRLASNNYINTSATTRVTCTSMDMYIAGQRTYRVVVESSDQNIQMGMQFLNQESATAIDNHNNIPLNGVQTFGYEESLDARRTTDATYNGSAIRLLRLTFKKNNDTAFQSVPITSIKVYDVTDEVTP